MAQHKNEDNILMMFNRFYHMCKTKEQRTLVLDMKYAFLEIPAADVVPKSEVEKTVDDLKRYIILNENIAIKCKQENGEQNEEYWKGKISAFKQIRAYIDAELKKKYTESGSILGECKFAETIHPEPLDSYAIRFVKSDGNELPPGYEAWESLPPLTIVGELSEEDKAKFLDDLSKGCLNLGFLFEKLKVTSIREESEDSVSNGNTEPT